MLQQQKQGQGQIKKFLKKEEEKALRGSHDTAPYLSETRKLGHGGRTSGITGDAESREETHETVTDRGNKAIKPKWISKRGRGGGKINRRSDRERAWLSSVR